ncbi:hypothetical protein LKI01_18400 [Companilactobacillus paralimentarius]|nr:hypothetical protein LKI01_18400 [Companilactobacillus paralimentarius]
MNRKCKRRGAVLLNSILILSVAILIVGYTSNLIGEQISGYRRLDEIYEQQINKKINKSNKIDYCELTNP